MTEPSVEFEDSQYQDEMDELSILSTNPVVLNSADWTAETILSQLQRGNIDLKPRFQRRDAWNKIRKSRFIESLIIGLPMPQIVLAERKGTKGQFLVLDGKQRLLTLSQYAGLSDGRNNRFKLTGLQLRPDLKNLSFQDLESDPQHKNSLDSLLNQTIRTVVIRNWPSIEFLHVVFLRLNTSSTQLSPQELRQALFPGPFVDFVDDRAANSTTLRTLLNNSEPDFRMRDTEILVRHLAFKFYMEEYAGSLSAFLDLTCDTLNRNWAGESELVGDAIGQFEMAIVAAQQVFGERYVGRKWTENGFESRLNRAVLDVITFYFSDPAIRDQAIVRRAEVDQTYKMLCEANVEFRQSIETTTKSLSAVHDRFALWGIALRTALQMSFNIPAWSNDGTRLIFDGFR